MFIDALTEVSTAQALSGTSATVSEDSIDLKAASRLGNTPVMFNVNVSSVSGTSPTLKVEVVGADDAALTSNVVSLGAADPVIAASQAAKNYRVCASQLTKKRYIGLRYTMGGTTPACTVTAGVAADHQADYQA